MTKASELLTNLTDERGYTTEDLLDALKGERLDKDPTPILRGDALPETLQIVVAVERILGLSKEELQGVLITVHDDYDAFYSSYITSS